MRRPKVLKKLSTCGVGFSFRKASMILPETLDFYFPFIVMGYGVIMSLVLSSPTLMKLADQRLPGYWSQRFKRQQVFAMICLAVGTLWSVQNIWTY